ncbi:MAG: tetratricopeptide repeat protein [candidate division Zixibacteria bacterium]|nr:tetratricopeptide repeat protein [candidate division Zixibacteria bacterium]
MRRKVLLAAVLFWGAILLSSCAKKVPEGIEWASSLEDALKSAQKEDKHVIADFYSEKCPWCDRLEDSTFTHPEVIALSKDIIFVKSEAKKDTALRDQYEIAGFPTVILMKSSGEEIDRIYGYLPPEEFVSTIQSYLQGKETLEDIENKFRADSTDVELAFKLADKYEARRRYDEAASYYQKVVDLDPEDKKGKSQDAMLNLAWLEIRKKEYLKAVDAFKNFLETYPKSEMAEDAERFIPYSYAKASDTTKALGLYQKFLKDYPNSEDTSWVREKIEDLKGEESTD